ncbi:MAG TPA: hypothetical protein VFX16_21705 [Pseudonocardiaceae bacterium]|nr:hypothetical protein [Pseudonocardiaceae bacterium]
MTDLRLAIAATVLGTAGTVSMIAYLAALRHVDIDVLPGRILPKAVWWRDHVRPVLGTSLVLVIVGLAGLVSG